MDVKMHPQRRAMLGMRCLGRHIGFASRSTRCPQPRRAKFASRSPAPIVVAPRAPEEALSRENDEMCAKHSVVIPGRDEVAGPESISLAAAPAITNRENAP